MAEIHYLSLKAEVPPTGYWDHSFLSDIFAGIGNGDREVVVIPGAYQSDVIPEINALLGEYKKVMVIVTSDEENKFNVDLLSHPDIIVYSQYGNGGWMFPLGYTPRTRTVLKNLGIPKKNLPWFFSGQNTHYRRHQMVDQLKSLSFFSDPRGQGLLVESKGFAQGLGKTEYLEKMSRTFVAPCAPGPMSVESFRFYEALEAGAIPVVDDMSPMRSSPDQYWRSMFGYCPFPIFTDYAQVPDLIKQCLDDPDMNNRVYAWWINAKHQLRARLKQQLGVPDDDMAITIPVSPIPSHPSTAILEETIKSIRVHTDSPILLTFDGIRPEQEDRRADYREFIRRMLWKCNFEYENVLPVIFNEHTHQSGMMNKVLENVHYPFIMYVEQDTPLTPDWHIELDKIKEFIRSGEANLVRLHFENFIPEPHQHLMVGTPVDGFQATRQWSQRPHIASTEYYKRVMRDYFTENTNSYIETRMHGICQSEPWENHLLWIYHPEGETIKRSYHTNGREGAESYEDRSIY